MNLSFIEDTSYNTINEYTRLYFNSISITITIYCVVEIVLKRVVARTLYLLPILLIAASLNTCALVVSQSDTSVDCRRFLNIVNNTVANLLDQLYPIDNASIVFKKYSILSCREDGLTATYIVEVDSYVVEVRAHYMEFLSNYSLAIVYETSVSMPLTSIDENLMYRIEGLLINYSIIPDKVYSHNFTRNHGTVFEHTYTVNGIGVYTSRSSSKHYSYDIRLNIVYRSGRRRDICIYVHSYPNTSRSMYPQNTIQQVQYYLILCIVSSLLATIIILLLINYYVSKRRIVHE